MLLELGLAPASVKICLHKVLYQVQDFASKSVSTESTYKCYYNVVYSKARCVVWTRNRCNRFMPEGSLATRALNPNNPFELVDWLDNKYFLIIIVLTTRNFLHKIAEKHITLKLRMLRRFWNGKSGLDFLMRPSPETGAIQTSGISCFESLPSETEKDSKTKQKYDASKVQEWHPCAILGLTHQLVIN